ncbi:MAG: hypothetical protein U0457_12860 [Candidatus Sericytochromatia bacterium]
MQLLKNLSLAISLGLCFSCSSNLTTSNVSQNELKEETTFSIKASALPIQGGQQAPQGQQPPQMGNMPKPQVSGSCPPPPPPPPIPQEVLAKIKAENPTLLTQVEALKSLTPDEFFTKMTELAKQYPQYFKAPPPKPQGSCPPPPQGQQGQQAPQGQAPQGQAPQGQQGSQSQQPPQVGNNMPKCPPPPPSQGQASQSQVGNMPKPQVSGSCPPPPQGQALPPKK